MFVKDTMRKMRYVMWPATTQLKSIPLPDALPPGTLNTLKGWVYDIETTEVVIQTAFRNFRMANPKDLFRFSKQDIMKLSLKQLECDNDMFEADSKEWTSMLLRIIEHGWYAGVLYGTGKRLVIKE